MFYFLHIESKKSFKLLLVAAHYYKKQSYKQFNFKKYDINHPKSLKGNKTQSSKAKISRISTSFQPSIFEKFNTAI